MTLSVLEPSQITTQSEFNPQPLIGAFLAQLDVKESSKAVYKRNLGQFFLWLNKRYAINKMNAITSVDIIAYKQYLLDIKKASHTAANYVTVVRIFFDWLESEGIYKNVAKKVKAPKRPKNHRRDCLTVDQVKRALATFDLNCIHGARNFALFNLLVRTGLRSIEVVRATVGDIRQDSGESILWIQGKGRDDKDEFVLLVPETIEPIRRYLSMRGPASENAPLFSKWRKPMTEFDVRHMVKLVLRSIDIDDPRLCANSLRHTAVSLSIRGGASLIQAQAMARHSNPQTTMTYFHNIDRVTKGAEKHIVI